MEQAQAGTGVPVDHGAFEVFAMRPVTPAGLDASLAEAGSALAVVFLWGYDCFNCEIAKKAMLARPDEIRALDLHWLHCNVYEHPQLAQRFGLHGVPTWMFFHQGKKLGRATGWHGLAQFQEAVKAARAKIAAKNDVNPAPGP